MSFAALTIDLNARLNKFEQDLSRAGKGLDNLNTRVGSIATGFNKAFGALGIGIGVAGLGAFVKSGIDAADALNDMSLRLGVSVKDLASFKLAAEQSGTSLESVGTGIDKLTKNIGLAEAGNKALAKALTDLGVTARDPKEAFFQLADATKRIEDPTKRAALLSQVLGKSYSELVPLLAQGGDELRKAALASKTYAEQMADLAPNADKFNDNLAELKQNSAAATASLLNELVPVLNEVYSRMKVVKDLLSAGGLFNTLNTTIGASDFAEVMQRTKRDIIEVQSAIEAGRAGGKDTSGFEERLRGLNAQLVVLKQQSRDAALALGETFKNYKVPQIPEKKKRDLDLSAATEKGKAFDPTKLPQIDPYIKERTAALKAQADAMAETERDVAEHLKATNDEIFAQGQAWKDAGRAIEDEYRTPLQKLEDQLAYLDELMIRGVISVEAYGEANKEAFEKAGESASKTADVMDEFSKNAAESMQRSFSDFFFDPMENGFKGMVKNFGDAILRMVADAAAADLTRALFGGNDKQGGGSAKGGLMDIFSSVGKLFSFDTGTDFVPHDMIAKIHKGERIIPASQNNGSRGINITVNVSGNNNAPDVRRAAAQGAREAMGIMSGAQRYA